MNLEDSKGESASGTEFKSATFVKNWDTWQVEQQALTNEATKKIVDQITTEFNAELKKHLSDALKPFGQKELSREEQEEKEKITIQVTATVARDLVSKYRDDGPIIVSGLEERQIRFQREWNLYQTEYEEESNKIEGLPEDTERAKALTAELQELQIFNLNINDQGKVFYANFGVSLINIKKQDFNAFQKKWDDKDGELLSPKEALDRLQKERVNVEKELENAQESLKAIRAHQLNLEDPEAHRQEIVKRLVARYSQDHLMAVQVSRDKRKITDKDTQLDDSQKNASKEEISNPENIEIDGEPSTLSEEENAIEKKLIATRERIKHRAYAELNDLVRPIEQGHELTDRKVVDGKIVERSEIDKLQDGLRKIAAEELAWLSNSGAIPISETNKLSTEQAMEVRRATVQIYSATAAVNNFEKTKKPIELDLIDEIALEELSGKRTGLPSTAEQSQEIQPMAQSSAEVIKIFNKQREDRITIVDGIASKGDSATWEEVEKISRQTRYLTRMADVLSDTPEANSLKNTLKKDLQKIKQDLMRQLYTLEKRSLIRAEDSIKATLHSPNEETDAQIALTKIRQLRRQLNPSPTNQTLEVNELSYGTRLLQNSSEKWKTLVTTLDQKASANKNSNKAFLKKLITKLNLVLASDGEEWLPKDFPYDRQKLVALGDAREQFTSEERVLQKQLEITPDSPHKTLLEEQLQRTKLSRQEIVNELQSIARPWIASLTIVQTALQQYKQYVEETQSTSTSTKEKKWMETGIKKIEHGLAIVNGYNPVVFSEIEREVLPPPISAAIGANNFVAPIKASTSRRNWPRNTFKQMVNAVMGVTFNPEDTAHIDNALQQLGKITNDSSATRWIANASANATTYTNHNFLHSNGHNDLYLLAPAGANVNGRASRPRVLLVPGTRHSLTPEQVQDLQNQRDENPGGKVDISITTLSAKKERTGRSERTSEIKGKSR
ncbi:MAG: hypothetical protein V4568_00730 [Pseudomonadota bacterium]